LKLYVKELTIWCSWWSQAAKSWFYGYNNVMCW